MVHVVPTFRKPLEVVVDDDGIVISSPQGLDVVLTPKAARDTAKRLTMKAEEGLAKQRKTPRAGAGARNAEDGA